MNFYNFQATDEAGVFQQIFGNYVYFIKADLTGTDDDTILLTDQTGQHRVILTPGQGVDLDGNVTDWYVYNHAGVGTIKGVLLIGKGRFYDNRPAGATRVVGTVRTEGVVDVVDGGKARTLDGVAYVAAIGVGSGGEGTYQHGQIWNPPSSGKRLIVESLSVASSTATQLNVHMVNATLANIAEAPANKLANGPASVAQMRLESNATPKPHLNFLQCTLLAGGIPLLVPFKEPIVVLPGYGIMVRGQVANIGIYMNLEYFEEPVA
jgi:hypothetical protein